MAKKKQKQFIMVFRRTLKSDAWKELTNAERITYIHLKAGWTGANNGDIHLCYSEMQGILSKPTLYRALDRLEELGWIIKRVQGSIINGANKYELTFKYDRQ